MKRFSLGLLAIVLLGAAVAFSAGDQATQEPQLQRGPRNPWTHLNLNNDPGDFQFAIVSDRTGGHRANVFAQAVERLNLLQPEFVLSVGDLIEGGRKSPEKLAAEWEELDRYIKRLEMPFFYVPGNHDVGNTDTARYWQGKLGRRYYHFVYRNVLFLILNTEDPPGNGPGRLGKEQLEYAARVLAENQDGRWTIVAMHKPIWTAANVEATGLLELEKALGDRPYTVFVGHVHRYQKFVRKGRNYYQLATTGGGSKMRGVDYGEFDHIVWVTMKKEGPVLANIMLDAVLPDDLSEPKTDETGVSIANRKKLYPVRGKIFFEGTPIPGAAVFLQPVKGSLGRGAPADGRVEADGSFTFSTYTANDGVAEGDYDVTVVWRQGTDARGRPGPNLLPTRYARAGTSGLKASIRHGSNELLLELQK